MATSTHKFLSGSHHLEKFQTQSLKNPQRSNYTQHSSEVITLRKQSINTLARSLLQRQIQQNNLRNQQRPQSNNPKSANVMILAQTMSKAKQNTDKKSQMQKLEQLKNRFKKIKNSYEQNHKFINSNIKNCFQNYKDRCAFKQSDSKVNAFEILNEDLTFSQSRQFNSNNSIRLQNQNREISFRNEMSPMEHITVNPYHNKENFISSANQSLSHTYNEAKYKSLSKELQNMRHGELVEMLIQQIEDNEKNKHTIMQQAQLIGSMRKQAQQRYSQVPRLKDEIESKLQQIQSKREQMEILLETQRKNLEIIEKLKRQLHQTSKNHEKSFFLQHSQIHKAGSVRKQIGINNSQDSSKIFAQKQEDESVDYKAKHQELKKYMNEYINNVNHAYEEYKRHILQLQDSNRNLNQQSVSLKQELQQTQNVKSQLQNQNAKLSKQFQKLSHALANSKEVIEQLEEEFLILKEQNSDLKNILQRQGPQFIQIKNSKQLMIRQIDDLIIENQALHHKNQTLHQEIAQIQSNILANSQIEAEVKVMFQGIAQQKDNLHQQLLKHVQDNEKLAKQLRLNEQNISALKLTIKTQQQKVVTLQTNIKCLQQTIQELNTNSSMLEKQNHILEETNQQMEKLQEELFYEFECEKDEKLKLRSELVQIMDHVKQMQSIYLDELSSNELIKNELSKFWQNQACKTNNLAKNHHNKQHGKSKKSNLLINPASQVHLKYQNQNEDQKMSNSQVCQKKNSLMTKCGSSSVLRNNINSDELYANSKFSEQSNNQINAYSIVNGSRISQKYYSETDEDAHQELHILRSSKQINSNMNFDNAQGKIRLNGRVGCVKNKENR